MNFLLNTHVETVNKTDFKKLGISYSLMAFVRKRTMKVDGSKIIFG